jgi:flagellar hook-basal body complex protein FliE
MLTALSQIESIASAGTSGVSGAGWTVPNDMGTLDQSTAQGAPFGDLLTDAIGNVNRLENRAQTAVAGLMTGTGVDVHDAMIATQKASMAFELALAVRNKAVQAYQQVMSMQF